MAEKKSPNGHGELRSDEIVKAEVAISHDEIARQAYALWEERGSGEGAAEQDWFDAEQRLQSLKTKAQAA